jgi:hypothetical protein
MSIAIERANRLAKELAATQAKLEAAEREVARVRNDAIQADEFLSTMGYHFPDQPDSNMAHIMHFHEMCGNWLRKALTQEGEDDE